MLSGQMVVGIGKDDAGLEATCLLRCHGGISHYDTHIANLNLTGSGTVQADAAAMAWTLNNIGVKTLTIVVVNDMDTLAGYETGSIHELLVNSDAAHVIEVGLSDTSAVYFAFQNFDLHVT